jgi:cysteine dioxygenase
MIHNALENAFGSFITPTPAEVKQALASLPIDMETIAPLIPQPDDLPYGRKVLFATPYIEVILIHLPPAKKSDPHNHGASYGWEWVLTGDLTNVIYAPVPPEQAEGHEVLIVKTNKVSAGDFCFVGPGEIHAIHNEGQTPVISINAYAPPLANCQKYRTGESAI